MSWQSRTAAAAVLCWAAAWAIPAGGQEIPPSVLKRMAEAERRRARQAASRPATATAPAETDKKTDDERRIVKFLPPTPEQIAAFRKRAQDWADQTRKTIVRHMHLVETEHFLIYSAWSGGNDRALKNVCERMYDALCKQFDIPKDQSIWVGKCPIYVFWEAEHFRRFCTEVDKRGNPKAAGYCTQSSSGFVYVVMSRARTKTWFYELLIHESTHGFLARYKTNRHIITWVNEGLAEYMAATLVPGARANRKYVDATAEAARSKRDVTHIFKGVGLNTFDYGIAQSLVRFLLARDRKRFIKFIDLMKEGRSDEQALTEAYGFGRAGLVEAWSRAVARKLR